MKTRSRTLAAAVVAAVLPIVVAKSAAGQVVQTFGAGSAVSVINGSASFENPSSLFDNPYLEGGMSFSRTLLSFNNNGCGFAGCTFHTPFSSFSGNYMYGVGAGGFFTMATTGSARFFGLEFIASTGFVGPMDIFWEAWLNGSLVASGSALGAAVGQVIGFSSASGFDELRYWDGGNGQVPAPAFDEVRAQFTVTAVPEPATVTLLAVGLVGIAAAARMRRRRV